MGELLRLLADDRLTREQFWKQMHEQGLTDADIDRYCRGEK